MAKNSQVDFRIHRLNWVDDEDVLPLFKQSRKSRTDLSADVEHNVFHEAEAPVHDTESTWGKTRFKWAIRNYQPFPYRNSPTGIVTFVLARAELERYGPIITDRSVEPGFSSTSPPSPLLIRGVVLLARHIAALQYNSTLMRTDVWRQQLHQILAHSARARDLAQIPKFEPIAPREELMDVFMSFTTLRRLRVKLFLPNPDLTEHTKQLHERLKQSRIQSYIQDMSNNEGLSKEQVGIPRATVEMAQAGYKEGEVFLAGERNGRHEEVRTGQQAARVLVDPAIVDALEEGSGATPKERAELVHSLAKRLEGVVDTIQDAGDGQ